MVHRCTDLEMQPCTGSSNRTTGKVQTRPCKYLIHVWHNHPKVKAMAMEAMDSEVMDSEVMDLEVLESEATAAAMVMVVMVVQAEEAEELATNLQSKSMKG